MFLRQDQTAQGKTAKVKSELDRQILPSLRAWLYILLSEESALLYREHRPG